MVSKEEMELLRDIIKTNTMIAYEIIQLYKPRPYRELIREVKK